VRFARLAPKGAPLRSAVSRSNDRAPQAAVVCKPTPSRPRLCRASTAAGGTAHLCRAASLRSAWPTQKGPASAGSSRLRLRLGSTPSLRCASLASLHCVPRSREATTESFANSLGLPFFAKRGGTAHLCRVKPKASGFRPPAALRFPSVKKARGAEFPFRVPSGRHVIQVNVILIWPSY